MTLWSNNVNVICTLNIIDYFSSRQVIWSDLCWNAYPSGHLVPSPILGLANAPIVETKFLAMSLLDFSPRIPLGTFSILPCIRCLHFIFHPDNVYQTILPFWSWNNIFVILQILWRYARYCGPFCVKLAGTILRHIFCDMDIEILANLVPIETENIREHIHIEIYWFSFYIF